MAAAQWAGAGGPRTAALGISTTAICGVRDHGALLAAALEREGLPCSTHWLDRQAGALNAARAEVGAWTQALPAELAGAHAEAALLHYSVFSYSHRGLPLFTHPVLAAVRRAELPLVTLMHEFVYPWGRDGVRGTAWALSQRALLIDLVRASDALVMTTDFQAEWLASRRWLAKRPLAVARVFSTLPTPDVRLQRERSDAASIGLFGYSYGRETVALVVDALRVLQDRGVLAQLRLLGAPGVDSPVGQEWLAAARDSGLARTPSFSGLLSAQGLSDALAACGLLLFADPLGPNSRKTTLAASLASGTPVLAFEGARRWPELVDACAVELVARSSWALADALGGLLADAQAREQLAAHGQQFAERHLTARRSAHTIAALLRDVAGR